MVSQHSAYFLRWRYRDKQAVNFKLQMNGLILQRIAFVFVVFPFLRIGIFPCFNVVLLSLY